MSPSNVVVAYDGGVKVVDFGIAKMAADPELSKRYALKGKLAYMSPEQLHNQPIDRRSDLFSLGIVLYEITTHSRLFKGATEVDTMRMVLEGLIATPSTIDPDYPKDLEPIVMRALEKDPDKRYASARDLQLDLEAFARDRRLHISSAGLADWMETSFGPKREIWRRCPPRRRRRKNRRRPPSRRQPRGSWLTSRSPVRPESGVRVGDNSATPVTASLLGRQPGKPSSTRAVAAIVAGAGALAIAAVLWFGRGHAAAPAAVASGGAPGTSVVMLVTERGAVAVEPGPSAPPTPTPPPSRRSRRPWRRPASRRCLRVSNAGGGPRPTRSPVSRRR